MCNCVVTQVVCARRHPHAAIAQADNVLPMRTGSLWPTFFVCFAAVTRICLPIPNPRFPSTPSARKCCTTRRGSERSPRKSPLVTPFCPPDIFPPQSDRIFRRRVRRAAQVARLSASAPTSRASPRSPHPDAPSSTCAHTRERSRVRCAASLAPFADGAQEDSTCHPGR